MSTKRKRSMGPDLEVIVGGQSFHVLRAALCCVSDVFDAMLDAGMSETSRGRIELPDKDPDEWKLFYSFIDPSTARFAEINEENVNMLASWFNEYQMLANLEECDKWIHNSLKETLENVLKDDESQDDWDKLLQRLEESDRCDWPITRTGILAALKYKFSDESEAIISVDTLDRLKPLLNLQEVVEMAKHAYETDVSESIRIIFAERVASCEIDAETAWNFLETCQLIWQLIEELEIDTEHTPNYSDNSVTDADFIAKVEDDVKDEKSGGEVEVEPQLNPSSSVWDSLFEHIKNSPKNPMTSAAVACFFKNIFLSCNKSTQIHNDVLSDLRVVLADDADVAQVLRESIEELLPQNIVEQIADTELHEPLCWSLVEAHVKISQLENLAISCLTKKYVRVGGMILRMQKAAKETDKKIQALPTLMYHAMPARKTLDSRANEYTRSVLKELMVQTGIPV